jgi:hypothetical protein
MGLGELRAGADPEFGCEELPQLAARLEGGCLPW